MATFQLFFQSGRAKDLSAPLYRSTLRTHNTIYCDNEKASLGKIKLLISLYVNAYHEALSKFK